MRHALQRRRESAFQRHDARQLAHVPTHTAAAAAHAAADREQRLLLLLLQRLVAVVTAAPFVMALSRAADASRSKRIILNLSLNPDSFNVCLERDELIEKSQFSKGSRGGEAQREAEI
jgi:hypothetical protein